MIPPNTSKDTTHQVRSPHDYASSLVILGRVSKDYYEVNMSPPAPNLLILDPSPLLEARHRKHAKLVAMKEKSRERRNNGKDSDSSEF